MAHTAPALPAGTTHTRGRGGTSQSQAGGRTISTQGKTEAAKRDEEKREEEGSKESKDEKN